MKLQCVDDIGCRHMTGLRRSGTTHNLAVGSMTACMHPDRASRLLALGTINARSQPPHNSIDAHPNTTTQNTGRNHRLALVKA